MRAWGLSTGPTACALAGRRCSLWGWRKGVPGGGAFHHCEGRLRSGAVPPPTVRPLGGLLGSATHVLWARVCGCGGPTLSPSPACPVRAACRGGGGGPCPGGVACHRCESAWCQALSLPRPPVLWSGQPGFRVPCVPGAVDAGVGTQHRPHSVRPCGLALLAAGGGGRASPGGGVLSTVVRGACCQALSLPRPPVLWSGQPGFRVPCVPDAVGAGVGTQHRPHSVRPWGLALLAVGVAEGRPLGGCLPPLRGASEVRRCPSPDCPPIGRAVGVRHPRAVGAGVWVWGPDTVPLACMPCGGCVPRGWWGAVPGGGGLPPL